MTLFDGQADNQSLHELNRLLDEGWRIAGINPTQHRVQGAANSRAFIVELSKQIKAPV